MFNTGAIKNSGNISIRYQVKLKLNFNELLSKSWEAKERNLRRAGAIVRGIMRKLIKYRKNPRLASPPGKPPYAHFNPGVKNTIQFVSDRNRMIVGPQIAYDKPNISPVPGALEHGGRTLVKVPLNQNGQKKKKKKKNAQKKPLPPWLIAKIAAKKKAKPKAYVKVPATIRPRPFAGPALQIFATSPQYAEIWRNCIK